MDRFLLQNQTGQNIPPKTIYLVRHGQSTHNAHALEPLGASRNDIRYIDAPLTEIGVQQAQQISSKLKQINPQLIVTSPMIRATQTCLHACADLQAPIIVSPLCRERLAYVCDIGSPVEDLERMFPNLDYSHVMPRDAYWWTPHSMLQKSAHASAELLQQNSPRAQRETEPKEFLRARVDKFRIWLLQRPETVIAVFTHGAFLNKLLSDGKPFFKNAEIRKWVI